MGLPCFYSDLSGGSECIVIENSFGPARTQQYLQIYIYKVLDLSGPPLDSQT